MTVDTASPLTSKIQSGIPLVPRPFRELGEGSAMDEQSVIKMLKELKENKILRDISGIFNGMTLGYTTALVAFSVEENKLEETASTVSSHPGVSHNYERNHEFNLWFTLAEENRAFFDETIERLVKICGVKNHGVLWNEKQIKIGVHSAMGEGTPFLGDQPDAVTLTDKEKEGVTLLQRDLPLVPEPFKELTVNSSLSEEELLAIGQSFIERKIMRRYAGVLRHRKAGFTSNAMTVWKAEENQTDPFAREKSVSHCYMRSAIPGVWEYPLFAMIHGKSREELDAVIASLREESGIEEFQVLETVREFKKKRVKYFSQEFKKWRDDIK